MSAEDDEKDEKEEDGDHERWKRRRMKMKEGQTTDETEAAVRTSPACGWHAQVLIHAAQFERFTSKDFAVAQRFKDRLAWRRRDTVAIDGVADGDWSLSSWMLVMLHRCRTS